MIEHEEHLRSERLRDIIRIEGAREQLLLERPYLGAHAVINERRERDMKDVEQERVVAEGARVSNRLVSNRDRYVRLFCRLERGCKTREHTTANSGRRESAGRAERCARLLERGRTSVTVDGSRAAARRDDERCTREEVGCRWSCAARARTSSQILRPSA